MKASRMPIVVVFVWLAMLLPRPSGAQTSTVSGEFSVEPPTLVSLGFDWKISGDDNRTAHVEVSYRKKGEADWRKALPLLRLHREEVNGRVGGPSFTDAKNAAASAAAIAASAPPPPPATPAPSGRGAAPQGAWGGRGGEGGPGAFSPFSYVAPNMFSGSVLDLQPDTDYEIRLVLSDPDGVKGETQKLVTARTRKEPKPASGGKVYHVYPVGYEGPREEPSFTGLMAAYYMGAAHYDYQNAFPPRVLPGDVILMHAGLYVSDRFHYLTGAPSPGRLALATYFDGTYYLTQSGTPDRPIVIKAAGDGEVVFDGDGAQNLFNVMAANHNYFEGLTIRNTNVAFLAGIKDIAGASGFTLKRSKIYNVGRGVQDDWSGSKNFYIADNVLIGRHDPDKMMGWNGAIWQTFPGFPELLSSEYAIKVYGQGHVVAYNYIANWHDGIDIATYGNPDGTPNDIPDRFPMAIRSVSTIRRTSIFASSRARPPSTRASCCRTSTTATRGARPISAPTSGIGRFRTMDHGRPRSATAHRSGPTHASVRADTRVRPYCTVVGVAVARRFSCSALKSSSFM